MNAWMISYSFYEIDYRVRRYAEALAEVGIPVEVFALRKENLPKYEEINGVKVHRIQNRQINERSPLTFFFRILLFFIRALTLVSLRSTKRRPDLIHVHNVPDFLVFTCLVPKLFGTRIILDIHDILPEFYCQKFGISMKHPLARVLRLVEYMSGHFADHVITANDIWRDKIIKRNNLNPEKCTAILNYPDELFFSGDRNNGGRQAEDSFRIFYPGTISHLHGIDIAIRAIGILRKDIPQVRLDIYSSRTGGFPYFDKLTALMDELDLHENVSFHPSVPHTEISDLLSRCDVGIVPKREGVFASEAFSTKIFEFMAAGVPVVASRTKIDKYYFDDSIITFFEPENAEDLAIRLLGLYQHPEMGKQKAAKAREFMSDKNWSEKKQLYYAIVGALLGRDFSILQSPEEANVTR